ncbi:MAG: hypothetical protein KIT16_09975 [Rhodospirillaceae bacterium]|nr:hypothetical protein [Rhodospirillaceae bacterium]
MISAPSMRTVLQTAPFLLAATLVAAPAAAQCWSGGTPGSGVPREGLLIVNRAPFPVNVMAGPANGTRRILGQVPAGSTMRFLAVLPPGRNETTIWTDAEQAARYRLPSPRVSGTVNIVNRGAATCRRAAQLVVTPAAFAGTPRRTNNLARRGTDLSTLAPAAGPRRGAPPAPPAGRTPGDPNGGAGVIRY